MSDVAGEHVILAEQHLREVVATLGGDVVVETDAFIGHPAEELVHMSEFVDLMVVGSRGYGPRRAVLLGSVSRHLMNEAACPVIVLPRGVEGAFESLLGDSGSVGASA
jgi:nucleotide-binding universal stress UspA family protein